MCNAVPKKEAAQSSEKPPSVGTIKPAPMQTALVKEEIQQGFCPAGGDRQCLDSALYRRKGQSYLERESASCKAQSPQGHVSPSRQRSEQEEVFKSQNWP